MGINELPAANPTAIQKVRLAKDEWNTRDETLNGSRPPTLWIIPGIKPLGIFIRTRNHFEVPATKMGQKIGLPTNKRIMGIPRKQNGVANISISYSCKINRYSFMSDLSQSSAVAVTPKRT